MLKPRVKKAFGVEATNVFKSVVGAGRADRQRDFITTFDELCLVDSEKVRFDQIVDAVGTFMKGNNDMMSAVRERAWWVKYVYAGAAALAIVGGWRIATIWNRSGSQKTLSQ